MWVVNQVGSNLKGVTWTASTLTDIKIIDFATIVEPMKSKILGYCVNEIFNFFNLHQTTNMLYIIKFKYQLSGDFTSFLISRG